MCLLEVLLLRHAKILGEASGPSGTSLKPRHPYPHKLIQKAATVLFKLATVLLSCLVQTERKNNEPLPIH
jgi:hypothetical protein